MQTYGRPLFVGFIHLKPEAPRFEVKPTNEIEHPWRVCPDSLVVKLPKGRGMVLGRWRKSKVHWEQSLMEILKGREIDFEETIAGNAENISASREDLGHA